MSFVQYHRQPELRSPLVIAAFSGWNDAADSATTAVKFLIEKWKPAKLADIDAEEFYVFTETRPTVQFVGGIQRTIAWPTNQFLSHSAPDQARDMILYLGVEPQLKWRTFSRKGLLSLHQMHDVAVAIGEEHEAVSLGIDVLAQETHSLLLEMLVCGVEIIDGDGEMADAWILHLVGSAGAFRGDDFQHAAIGGLDEIVAGIGEVDVELEMVHIPFGERFGVWRGDRGVL